MKRLLVLVLALSMMICFAACGDEQEQQPVKAPEKTPERTVEQIEQQKDEATGIDDEKMNDAVAEAIFEYNKGKYPAGEVAGEGHKLIETKEVDGKLYIYAYVRYGEFKMQDDAMCKIGGSGAVPTLLIFDKDLNFIEAKEPSYESQEEYEATAAQLFPQEIMELFAAFHDDPQGYNDLSIQEACYVEIYMKEKGIEAIIKQ